LEERWEYQISDEENGLIFPRDAFPMPRETLIGYISGFFELFHSFMLIMLVLFFVISVMYLGAAIIKADGKAT
jgi:hypothetical protein